MTLNDDLELKKWAADWQAAPPDIESAERIRHYVKRRGALLWWWFIIDFVVAGVALPILFYLGWMAEAAVERFAMLGLASITIATACFGWWNWRGVIRSSATSVSEYMAISAERLRRMRLAWRIGWLVLSAQVAVFTIWIWEKLYSGRLPYNAGAERFAWSMLVGMTIAALFGLIIYGRWIRRDTKRFAALRREFEND